LIGTGYDIPLRTGIFDVVLAFRFLWHFEKGHRIHLLREFRRVLKQNGSVIYDFPSSRRVDEKEMNASAGSNIASYALSPLSLKEEAESVGLSVRRIAGNMSLSWVTKYISGLHRLRCESLAIRVIEQASRRNIGSPEEWLVCCGTM
jgi:SAM-dependent methyltransferase